MFHSLVPNIYLTNKKKLTKTRCIKQNKKTLQIKQRSTGFYEKHL